MQSKIFLCPPTLIKNDTQEFLRKFVRKIPTRKTIVNQRTPAGLFANLTYVITGRL